MNIDVDRLATYKYILRVREVLKFHKNRVNMAVVYFQDACRDL